MSPTADPDQHRASSLERWEKQSVGWARRREQVASLGAPASEWMIDHLRPEPGQRILELAAGTGETGLALAERVAPGGSVIVSDQAEGMIEAARRRASALGIENVEFRIIDAEFIDLELASVDGIAMRWGLMLLADPPAALQEMRRVLRPGGRLALSVWDAAKHNPWAALVGRELIRAGLSEPPAPGEPGMFALADPERLRGLLEDAGFLEIQVESLELEQRFEDVEDWWLTQSDLSRQLAEATATITAERREELKAALAEQVTEYVEDSGKLVLPARTLVVGASA